MERKQKKKTFHLKYAINVRKRNPQLIEIMVLSYRTYHFLTV